MREIFRWFVAAPEFWLSMLLLVGITCAVLATTLWREIRGSIGRWKHRRSAVPRRVVLVLAALFFSGCATSYKPKVTGPLPFAFTLTPEQRAQLKKERRMYRATEKTATYISSASALLTTACLAIPALRDEKAVQGVVAGITLGAGGVSIFSGSQVESLDEELELDDRLNRATQPPPPPLPTLAEMGILEPWLLEAVLESRDAKSRP